MGAEDIAMELANTGIGMLTQGIQDRRQLRQQKKLQNQQIEGQKEMGKYNQQMALEMWNATNYAEQRKQIEAGGLNPGLLYGMGGASGATANVPTGNVQGAHAPVGGGEIGMGLQRGLQAVLQKAQIENINANTEKTKVDTEKTRGVDTTKTAQDITQSQTQVENIKQSTQNAKIQQEILEYEKELKRIETTVKSQTQEQTIQGIQAATQKLQGEAEQEKNKGKLSTEEYSNIQKQIQQTTIEQAGRIALQKVQIKATEAQIQKIGAELWQIYNNANNENRQINQKDQQILLDKLRTEFQTGDEAQIQQIVTIWKDIINGISQGLKTFK